MTKYSCLAIRRTATGTLEIAEGDANLWLSVWWWLLMHVNYPVWKVYNHHTKRNWFQKPKGEEMSYTPVNPCKMCKQNQQKPKTIGGEVFWVHCDSCGNRGTEASTPQQAATNWNKENPQ